MFFANGINLIREDHEIMAELMTEGWAWADPIELPWEALGLPPLIDCNTWFHFEPNLECSPFDKAPIMPDPVDLFERARALG